MSHTDVRLGRLLGVYIDGVPLDLAGTLLPVRSRMKPSLMAHIHMHARYQKRYADGPGEERKGRVSRRAVLGIIDSLEGGIRRLEWHPAGTEWAEYYDNTNYSDASLEEKRRLVDGFLDRTGAATLWDLGANTGLFSRVAAGKGMRTVSFDVDPACVERNYLESKRDGQSLLTPLLMDFTNPSPSLGWAGSERRSLAERGPADAVMALALIHHLAISNNVPLPMAAEFLHGLGGSLIIEFVPKEDGQVRRLLRSRDDIFTDYHRQSFEEAFGEFFRIEADEEIPGTARKLYLMSARGKDS